MNRNYTQGVNCFKPITLPSNNSTVRDLQKVVTDTMASGTNGGNLQLAIQKNVHQVTMRKFKNDYLQTLSIFVHCYVVINFSRK